MDMNLVGQAAALLASICFAIGPTFNTLATRGASVATVNRARLVFTFLLLIIPHWLFVGSPFPTSIELDNLLWLSLSGLFALVLGDTLLFAAFNRLGTRLSMLIITLIPIFSSILAWIILDQKLSLTQTAGILITLAGIAWVVSERKNGQVSTLGRSAYTQGILLAIGSSLLHAFGNVTARLGLSGDISPVSGHLFRVAIAMIILLILMLLKGESRRTIQELKASPVTIRYIFIGSIFGPMLGSGLLMFALDNTSVAIASLLNSLSPVWLLPVGRYFFKENVGVRAVAGSLAAVVGVVVLLML